jgi:hypothetical protein
MYLSLNKVKRIDFRMAFSRQQFATTQLYARLAGVMDI